MKRSKTAAGFTLIELLVVLGIISILTAILMPVFQCVRERGRSATCQSNLKQLNLALQQYVADNDSAYPNSRTYQSAIGPYIKNRQIWECPSELERPGIGTGGNVDYGYNSLFLGNLVSGKLLGSHETRHVQTDTTKVLTFDDYPLPGGPRLELSDPCGTNKTSGIDISTRHSGGANYSYLDGHVKWLTPMDGADGWCYMYREIPHDSAPTP